VIGYRHERSRADTVQVTKPPLVSCPRSTSTYLGALAPLAALRLLRNRNRLRSSARLARRAAGLPPMSTYLWDRTLAAIVVLLACAASAASPAPRPANVWPDSVLARVGTREITVRRALLTWRSGGRVAPSDSITPA